MLRSAIGRRQALVYNRETCAAPAANRDAVAESPSGRASSRATHRAVTVFVLLAFIAIVAALAIGYYAGRAQRKDPGPSVPAMSASLPAAVAPPLPAAAPVTPSAAPPAPPVDGTIGERARIIRNFEAETAMLRRELVARDASLGQLVELAADRRRLLDEVAAARGETARYRQLVVDLENDAPPPFFGAGAPDDLKLIVGVGPVLERMLQQLGVATYRQIARWSERDIDEFDARLHEFPGRIRRDAWVTQARALHQSKYGETLPTRDRG
jgi:predicted flap endonuclease-1-like 5' DNA nuclease